MKAVRLSDFLQRIGGNVLRGDPHFVIRDVWTRWRKMTDDSILFALSGSLTEIASGVAAKTGVIVTDQRVANLQRFPAQMTVVYVQNVRAAYWEFVDHYRKLFQLPVIGVTGTCGKTTTKEMIRHILEMKHRQVQSTYKSKNGSGRNLGYLLGIEESTEVAVFEMGVQHRDDLLDSCRYFQPQIGILTMIGTDHLLYTGSQEQYFLEKCKLLEGLGNKGTLILNGDDANIQKMDLRKYRGQVIRYGVADRADFRATRMEYGTNGMHFTLCLQGLHYDLFVPGYGEHNVYNALAALAGVHVLGIGIAEAGEALRSFQHVERHLELRLGVNGCTILDDTWNTNPSSIEAALRVLKKISHGKKSVAVLGEIGEMGEHSVTIHEEVGAKVVEQGIDVLVTFGDDSRWIAEKARELGMRRSHVHICQTIEQAYQVIQELANKQTMILLKMSMFHSYHNLLDLLNKNE